MISKKHAAVVGIAALLASLSPMAAFAGAAANKKLVIAALTEFFVKRDPTAIKRYWGKNYIQHNPFIPDGSDHLPALMTNAPANFKYEMGLVIADGDLVAVHGRYTGLGPKPTVAVDIFRVANGKLVEHWDVLQDEVPAAQTKSGKPMFEPGK